MLIIVFAMQNKSNSKLYPSLQKYAEEIVTEYNQITPQRKTELEEIGKYVKKRLKDSGSCKLTFICTHNSRRSQFGQIWAKTAAHFYGIKNIETYSGGIEVTACNPRTIAALERAGFTVSKENTPTNPRYTVMAGEGIEQNILFSKIYSDAFNPQKAFVALMVCSDADEKCPLVFGAEERFSLPYTDPKVADNTPQENATYDERSRQIAREVFYIMHIASGN
jgi:arsenate reductase (thioredoxin)